MSTSWESLLWPCCPLVTSDSFTLLCGDYLPCQTATTFRAGTALCDLTSEFPTLGSALGTALNSCFVLFFLRNNWIVNRFLMAQAYDCIFILDQSLGQGPGGSKWARVLLGGRLLGHFRWGLRHGPQKPRSVGGKKAGR